MNAKRYERDDSMASDRKVVLFIAATLDGYIATTDDSLEWLFKAEGEGDNGTSEFYDTVDTVIMGRRTYDWLLDQEIEEFPYKDRDCYVYTRSDMPDNEDVKFINGQTSELIHSLKEKEGRNIWIMGGGELIHEYLQQGLVDEITVTVAPVILGDGIPLFRRGDYHHELEFKGSREFNQFVELNYTVKK